MTGEARPAAADKIVPNQRGGANPSRRPADRRRRTPDALRALAITMVVLYHAAPGAWWARGGYVGVDIFFALSGFLITQRLRERRYPTYSAFFRARVTRLVPCLLLAIVIGYPATRLVASTSRADYALTAASALTGLANLPAYTPGGFTAHSTLLVTWSLAVEEQFYALWPRVMRLGKRDGFPRRAKRLLVATIAASLASLLLEGLFWPSTAVIFHTEPRIGELLMGSGVALMSDAVVARRRWLWTLAALALPAGVVVATASTDGIFITFGMYGAAAGSAAALARSEKDPASARERRLPRWVDEATKQVAGCSYEWYLLHLPVIILSAATLDLRGRAGHVLEVVLGFIAAWLSARFVSRPVREWDARRRTPSIGNARFSGIPNGRG